MDDLIDAREYGLDGTISRCTGRSRNVTGRPPLILTGSMELGPGGNLVAIETIE
jgi:hypothetical protein